MSTLRCIGCCCMLFRAMTPLFSSTLSSLTALRAEGGRIPYNFKYHCPGHEVADLGNLIVMYAQCHSLLILYYLFDQFVHKVEQVLCVPSVSGEYLHYVVCTTTETNLYCCVCETTIASAFMTYHHSVRGKIFSKEVRVIQSGPGGIFFTGDGT